MKFGTMTYVPIAEEMVMKKALVLVLFAIGFIHTETFGQTQCNSLTVCRALIAERDIVLFEQIAAKSTVADVHKTKEYNEWNTLRQSTFYELIDMQDSSLVIKFWELYMQAGNRVVAMYSADYQTVKRYNKLIYGENQD